MFYSIVISRPEQAGSIYKLQKNLMSLSQHRGLIDGLTQVRRPIKIIWAASALPLSYDTHRQPPLFLSPILLSSEMIVVVM